MSEPKRYLGDFVILKCNNCGHTFSYAFFWGCMKDGVIETSCPECNQQVKIIEYGTMDEEDGEKAVCIIRGATRGLYVNIIPYSERITNA